MVASFALLAKYLKPQWPQVLLLAALILAGLGVQLINPQIMRYVLDQARAGAVQRQLMMAAGLFLLFGFAQAAITLATNYLGTDVSWNATNRLRADLALHCLRLDMGFHNAHTPGELIERVDGDVSKLADFFSQLVLRLLANGLLVAGIILMLLREDWRLGLAATGYAGLVVLFLQLVQEHTVRLRTKVSVTDANLGSLLEERLNGREDVRGNGGEGYVLRRLAMAQGERFGAVFPARLMDVFSFATTHLLLVLTTVLGLGIGAVLYLDGHITIGTVYLIVYYIGLLEQPLSEFRRLMAQLQAAAASAVRVSDLFAQRSSIAETVSTLPSQHLPEGSLAVTFTHVSFHYASANGEGGPLPSVLHDLSFTLPAGRLLGVLGRTGSGKTTLTRLLFRLYELVGGTIQLGGQDICHIPLCELRRRVGMVTQEVQLFGGTLRDNITLFNPNIEDETILDALQELGLWRWYLAQPNGLDTILASGGIGLSAGEAQLLAFVRIFLKDPGLVILDEASSRLDPATEQLLERAVDRLLQGRTAIIIAHRLETVQRVDDILILENGGIAEAGSQAALAANPASRFYHLLRTGLQEALT
jgi:ABC-type multidrug transport system fused ATPase/permease subunit